MEKKILDEIKRDDEYIEVELEHDIYSVGFITFLKADGPKRLNKIVEKCVWTFVFQLLLLGLLAYGLRSKKARKDSSGRVCSKASTWATRLSTWHALFAPSSCTSPCSPKSRLPR